MDLARCRFVLVAIASSDPRCVYVTYNHRVEEANIESMALPVMEQDQNVKTKTKTSLATARMHNRKTLFCCNAHVCYQKRTWCKKRQKGMTSNVWHCFCTYCTKDTGAYYISALLCHTASCRAQQCCKHDQSIRPRPKL